jgi:hypothetical protein
MGRAKARVAGNRIQEDGSTENKKGGQPKLPAIENPNKKCARPRRRSYSNFSVMMGNCSLALASDLTTMPSAVSGVTLREVAISLTRRYLAPSAKPSNAVRVVLPFCQNWVTLRHDYEGHYR